MTSGASARWAAPRLRRAAAGAPPCGPARSRSAPAWRPTEAPADVPGDETRRAFADDQSYWPRPVGRQRAPLLPLGFGRRRARALVRHCGGGAAPRGERHVVLLPVSAHVLGGGGGRGARGNSPLHTPFVLLCQSGKMKLAVITCTVTDAGRRMRIAFEWCVPYCSIGGEYSSEAARRALVRHGRRRHRVAEEDADERPRAAERRALGDHPVEVDHEVVEVHFGGAGERRRGEQIRQADQLRLADAGTAPAATHEECSRLRRQPSCGVVRGRFAAAVSSSSVVRVESRRRRRPPRRPWTTTPTTPPLRRRRHALHRGGAPRRRRFQTCFIAWRSTWRAAVERRAVVAAGARGVELRADGGRVRVPSADDCQSHDAADDMLTVRRQACSGFAGELTQLASARTHHRFCAALPEAWSRGPRSGVSAQTASSPPATPACVRRSLEPAVDGGPLRLAPGGATPPSSSELAPMASPSPASVPALALLALPSDVTLCIFRFLNAYDIVSACEASLQWCQLVHSAALEEGVRRALARLPSAGRSRRRDARRRGRRERSPRRSRCRRGRRELGPLGADVRARAST